MLAEILVLAGGATLPLPAVPSSTRISAMLKRAQDHSSPMSMSNRGTCYVSRRIGEKQRHAHALGTAAAGQYASGCIQDVALKVK